MTSHPTQVVALLLAAGIASGCGDESAGSSDGAGGGAGSPEACPSSTILCADSCVDTQTSNDHCGVCSHACLPGWVCSAGTCACPEGSQPCGSACVDVAADPGNCGGCGVACNPDETCNAGICSRSGTGGGGTGGGPGTGGGGTGGDPGTGGGDTGGDSGTGGRSSTGGGSGTGGGGTGGVVSDPDGPEPCEPVSPGEILAFPGAEGFGRFSPGGRGGDVCHVTQLGDSGAGSLRDCVSQGNRTVVFDVAGWITLDSNLGITQSNLTIAGQTAPGGGIGVRGRKVSVGGDNVIMRFVRVRRGIVATEDRDDAMTVSSAASNVIIDHCSIAFGTDENFSMPGDESVGPRDFTVQWTIIAYGLQRNNHSAGSLLTASNTTIHHSLYAFNKTRNPKARSEDGRVLDFVNNVIYGWNAPDPYGESQGWSISGHPFIMADTANGMHYANAVGNYIIAFGGRSASQGFVSGRTNDSGIPTYNLYFEGNLLDGNANGVLDSSSNDWSMVGTATQLGDRLSAPQVCTDDAPTAHERVLNGAGATMPVRDELEVQLVQSVRGQGGILIQDESDLGIGAEGYGALASGTAPPDSDADGMPDEWENARGLNPNDASDRNGDDDADGYTNLEEYLNQLAAPAWQP